MVTGCGGSEAEIRPIPDVVWGGGAAKVTVDVDMTGDGTLFVSFTERMWDEHGQHYYTARELQGIDRLPAGHHRYSIDVPAGVTDGGALVNAGKEGRAPILGPAM